MDHGQRMNELRARSSTGPITMFNEERARHGLRRSMVRVADLCAWDESELWGYEFPKILNNDCEFIQAELLFVLVPRYLDSKDWRLAYKTTSTDPVESKWALRKLDFQRLFYEEIKAGKLLLLDDQTHTPRYPQLTAQDLERLSVWINEDGDGNDSESCNGDSTTDTPSNVAGLRPLLQQAFQDQEILRVLAAAGYDPKGLPRRKAGKPGAKKHTRDQLKFSVKVFDKAWDRLRSAGEIKDAT